MLTIKQGIKISAIIDKMEIKIKDAKANNEEVGADLMLQLATKAHKAEKEIYSLVAELKNCTTTEAENIDLIEFIKTIAGDSGIASFFKSAVK